MSVILRSLVLFALIAYVVGHSIMTNPPPINTNPSKSAPCGVAAMPAKPVAAAQWAVGTAQTIAWKLVAADGGKALTAVLDTLGAGTAVAFPSSGAAPATTKAVFAAQAFGTAGVGSTTSIKFTVPAGTTCTGPNGLCVMRMVSDQGWNSCMYVNITQVVEPTAPTPAPTCTAATGLTYCSMLNGKQVTLKAGQSFTGLDSQVSQAFAAAINNTEVFTIGGQSAQCAADYKTYLCKENLPLCGSDANFATCTSDCKQMITECAITTEHAGYIPCTGLAACSGSAGGADSSSTITAASAVIAAGALGVAAFL